MLEDHFPPAAIVGFSAVIALAIVSGAILIQRGHEARAGITTASQLAPAASPRPRPNPAGAWGRQ